MSVQGTGPNPFRPIAPATGAGKAHAAGAHHAKAKSAAGGTQAPTDASLWDMLTDEEQAFFSQSSSLGALTYGRGATPAAATAAAPLGSRLDVRG